MNNHTLSILVSNRPGVLTRIAALFSRRGFNIQSLAVGPTEREDVSRMTVVAQVEDDATLEQIVKQLNKLIEVIKVVELDPTSSVQRQVMLIKVKADQSNRAYIISTVELFRAAVIDVGTDTLTIQATGKAEKLKALLEVLEPFGIKELVKSGSVALGRGAKAITERNLRSVERSA